MTPQNQINYTKNIGVSDLSRIYLGVKVGVGPEWFSSYSFVSDKPILAPTFILVQYFFLKKKEYK